MKTILVVEDDANQGLLYEQELEDEGYHVLLVQSGREAVEVTREARPDCVVLDINMPEMNGLETLGYLIEAEPKMPVILNSAYDSYQDNFMSWAADAYVRKSSDLSELKIQIARSLAIRAGVARS